MKILLLEDEYLLSQAICKYLLMSDYFVDSYDNGEDVLDIIQEKKYDFFILDLNTPKVGGLECLKVISLLYPQTPKIIISAYHDIEYISEAFEIGCSDYLKKPFSLKELEIRIKKLSQICAYSINKETVIKLSENYHFNTQNSMLYYKNEIQKFSKKEYALIGFFVENLNQIVGDETIRLGIWNDVDTQTSTVRSLVNRLRKKLHEELIQNIRGFGYILKTTTKE